LNTIDGAKRDHWRGMITAKDPIMRNGKESIEYSIDRAWNG